MPKQIKPKLLAVAIGHALAAMALVRDIVERRKGNEPATPDGDFVGPYLPHQPRKPKTQREAIVERGGRILSAQETFETLTGAREPQPGDYVRKIPKRIRSRHKPLTEADIVEGGVYVPKRGNDKTPNLVVEGVERTPTDGSWVSYYRVGQKPADDNDFDVRITRLEEFLALVARRAS